MPSQMLPEFENDTRVVNLNKEKFDVLICRPSKWGNPYTHIKDRKTQAQFVVRSRDEAIRKYREWVTSQPHLMNDLEELRGKRLGCYCKPKSCHGDILIELLNEKPHVQS